MFVYEGQMSGGKGADEKVVHLYQKSCTDPRIYGCKKIYDNRSEQP